MSMNSKRKFSVAATVAEIEDLLTDILLRLPAKSLIRFKCVSKQWLSLISSAQFGISHTQIHHIVDSGPAALLLNKGFENIDELQMVPLKKESLPPFDFMKVGQMKILQSCNGLLLCRSSLLVHPSLPIPADDNCVINGFVYYICNPTAGQFKRLSYPPLLKENLRFTYLISVCLAFDPTVSPHYKIIFIFDLCQKGLKSYLVEIYVYSSENDSWASRIADLIELRMQSLFPPTLGIGFHDGVLCNGAIHWSRCDGRSSLLCFMLDNWTFNRIFLPDVLKVRYFGESQGHLHVVAYKHWHYYTVNYYVLEIATDYSGWSVKYHLNLHAVRMAFPRYEWKFSILSIIRAKDEEESVIVLAAYGRVISYSLINGTWERICNLESRPGCSRASLDYEGESYQYFESLICI